MKAEIIGDGLLGAAFRKYEIESNAIIVCSGVSDSQEKRQSEFKREIELIKNISLNKNNKVVVYFSSVMAGFGGSEYYAHKSRVERLIVDSFDYYLICRLPQVVGLAINNTIFPTFVRSIVNRKSILIQRNATRTLLDVDDVVRIVSFLLEMNKVCRTVSICPSHVLSAIDLADLIAKELKIDLSYKIVDGGLSQKCDPSDMLTLLGGDLIFRDDYTSLLVRKYAMKLAVMIKNDPA